MYYTFVRPKRRLGGLAAAAEEIDMARSQLVTLLTDFGSRDGYVGAVKGAILSVCPRAQIVDISHDVPAHDILAGALGLSAAAPYFPPDTLHVVIIDPTVGTDRKILVGRFGQHVYLFPDNGVITFIVDRCPAESLNVVLPPAPVVGRPGSMTFHGRDVFAPIAGRILLGQDIRKFGPQPASYTLLDIPAPAQDETRITGQVIHVDRFGNLVTNIPAAAVMQKWPNVEAVRATCAGREAGRFAATYAFVAEATPLVLFDSSGRVELAVNRGRACDSLAADVGAPVILRAD
jgi:hypothetical protein